MRLLNEQPAIFQLNADGLDRVDNKGSQAENGLSRFGLCGAELAAETGLAAVTRSKGPANSLGSSFALRRRVLSGSPRRRMETRTSTGPTVLKGHEAC